MRRGMVCESNTYTMRQRPACYVGTELRIYYSFGASGFPEDFVTP